ncbi:MAG: hypothetical protein JWQ47_1319, partial [Glaciihabitans sp.]|nr:hypothetical protein [Glaciihabitans sp.]
PAAVLWSIVGFGGLLVIAAVLAVIVRAARRAPKVAAAAAPTAGIETFTEQAEPAKPADKDRPTG